MKLERPTCLNCGTPLRRYKFRGARFSQPGQQFGDYGDNMFCGLSCGYEWALWQLGICIWKRQEGKIRGVFPQDHPAAKHLRQERSLLAEMDAKKKKVKEDEQ